MDKGGGSMNVKGIGKWGVAFVAMAMVFVLGCSKKATLKSTDTGAPAGGVASKSEKGAGEIASEPLKPESGTSSGEIRTASREAAAGMAVTEEKSSPFQDVHFDFDKAVIRPEDRPILAKVADYMKKNGARLLVEGHCDERGTAEYNMALGDRRAESCRAYLVSLGVRTSNLTVVSYGKEKPVDPGHTEEAWAKNRRAHFVLK
jgi:peptidoglycan-associated lipoprotein